MRDVFAATLQDVGHVLRACVRPFGYLLFAAAVWSLGAAASLIGRDHVLGGFAGRVSDTIRRYPLVTRQGVLMAWLVWALLLALALSPLDPLQTMWDEVALIALASAALWTRALRPT
jgi:hypothetical protein